MPFCAQAGRRRPARRSPATETAEVSEGVGAMGAVQGQGTLDHRGLVRHAAGVQPGSRPDQRAHRRIQQRAGHGRRRNGIADAHLAADEQLAAGLLGAAHARARPRAPAEVLFGAHRRGLDEFAVPAARRRWRTPGKASRGTAVPRSTTSRPAPSSRASTLIAAPPDGVAQHLAGDRLRIGRDALGDYPVVAGKDRHPEPLRLSVVRAPATPPGRSPPAPGGPASRAAWSTGPGVRPRAGDLAGPPRGRCRATIADS